jgi:DNA-damage-inducible protein D
MKQNNYLKMNPSSTVFTQKKVRKIEHKGEMYYSIVDIIEYMTGTVAPRTYWAMLKKRDFQLLNVIESLKIAAPDGKLYQTDAANKAGILQILLSMPSPELEPFKTWLSKPQQKNVPQKSRKKHVELPQIQSIKGYSDEDLTKSLQALESPSPLINEWRQRGVASGIEYALLDATISKWTFDVTPTEHKELKGLTYQKLNDHMTSLEYIFKALAEEMTRCVTVERDAQGFIENYGAAQIGGKMAGEARRSFERDAGMKVVSSDNNL